MHADLTTSGKRSNRLTAIILQYARLLPVRHGHLDPHSH